MSEEEGSYWFIVLSLLAAAVLAVLPLTSALVWFRPEWLLLVLLYWAIMYPQRVGLLTAMVTGLLLDVLEGAPLGQNMLAMAIVVTLAGLMYQRLRVFTVAQQSLIVFLLVGLQQLIVQWLQNVQEAGADSFLFLLPALTSAVLWPLVLLSLRGVGRALGAN